MWPSFSDSLAPPLSSPSSGSPSTPSAETLPCTPTSPAALRETASCRLSQCGTTKRTSSECSPEMCGLIPRPQFRFISWTVISVFFLFFVFFVFFCDWVVITGGGMHFPQIHKCCGFVAVCAWKLIDQKYESITRLYNY